MLDFFKNFLFLNFVDGGGGSGGGSGGENGGGSEPSTEPSNTPNPDVTPEQPKPNKGATPDTGNAESKRVAELEKQIEDLMSKFEEQKQNEELNALIDQTRAELKSIEATFPEWNEQEQKRTVLDMNAKRVELQKNGQDLGERYKGTSGAFLYWKEHLAGNPSPSGNVSGYTPSEYEKKLIEKAESGDNLTKEERIKVLKLVKGV